MKSKRQEDTIVALFYVILRGLRLLFLSSRAGAYAHNLIYYLVLSTIPREAESQKMVGMLRRNLRPGYPGIVEWQKRCYLSSPNTVRHSIRNILARRLIACSLSRRRMASQGHVIPTVLLISVSTPDVGCNLACETCYFDTHAKGVLPLPVLRKILDEQESLGIYNVRLLGGEPFLYKGIWEVFADYPNTTFQVPTNGTHLNMEAIRRLTELGNVFPMISLEGFERRTDEVRGKGVFAKVAAAMNNCKQAKLPYGVLATVTRQNLEEVTGPGFLEFLDRSRCCSVGFSCYVPLGRGAHPEWQLTDTESERLDRVSQAICESYAMFPVVGRNGTGRVNDCSAAREFIHILPNGQVESCPFAQWADPNLNVADHSLLEIMASPFFAGIRELTSYGVAGTTPCRAPRLVSLQRAFAAMGAQPTDIAN